MGSLFAGIGGFDLGFERAGFEIKWQVEIDAYCQRVLAKHWPQVRRYGDIRCVNGADLEPVDVVVGGFPCKQTSVASAIHGRRVGLSGRDSGLWSDMRRVVSWLPVWPRFVVVENPESDALGQVQGDLETLGYLVFRRPFTARGFGAPHLRRRVFLVAYRDREGLASGWPSGPSEITGESWASVERNSWLRSLAGVLRVDDGVSNRVDHRHRISGIGNAVVPQAAEWIAREIATVIGTDDQYR